MTDINRRGECPPKDLIGQIHNYCFDYGPLENEVNGETIEQRLFNCWQGLHFVIKQWIEADEQNFLNYIKKGKPILPGRDESTE